jgi:hypothetical protein
MDWFSLHAITLTIDPINFVLAYAIFMLWRRFEDHESCDDRRHLQNVKLLVAICERLNIPVERKID